MIKLIIDRIKSIGYATKGAYILLTTEVSVKIQFFIGIVITIAGFYFEISHTEWMLQILTISAVMSIEGVNTAIEEIADFIHPEHHKRIGLIKDISAGAVFISAVGAIIVGGIIYIPKIF